MEKKGNMIKFNDLSKPLKFVIVYTFIKITFDIFALISLIIVLATVD